jgi:hypothetical protein
VAAGLNNGGITVANLLVPTTEEQKRAIRKHLDQVLAHPSFRNSLRSQSFLRYVAEYSLQEESAPLKERTVGIEVFGRQANYDASHDTVVRNTASETRRRLAEYYEDQGVNDRIQFKIPPGSYHVEFYQSRESTPESVDSPPLPVARKLFFLRNRWAVFIFASALAAALGSIGLWQRSSSTARHEVLPVDFSRQPLELFWKPILDYNGLVLICYGDSQSQKSPMENGSALESGSVPLSTAYGTAVLSGLLGTYHKQFQLKTADSLTPDDFNNNPVILIGGLDNRWTLLLTDSKRFYFVRAQSPDTVWIEDRTNKQSKAWLLGPVQGSASVESYAIVGRFREPGTRYYTTVAAGLGPYGTRLASVYLTDPSSISELTKSLPKDWPSKNIEIVIAAHPINGAPGPPRVLAVEVW